MFLILLPIRILNAPFRLWRWLDEPIPDDTAFPSFVCADDCPWPLSALVARIAA